MLNSMLPRALRPSHAVSSIAADGSLSDISPEPASPSAPESAPAEWLRSLLS